jgi:hypothetical protein
METSTIIKQETTSEYGEYSSSMQSGKNRLFDSVPTTEYKMPTTIGEKTTSFRQG